MIVISRLPEPPILASNKEMWLQVYLERRTASPRLRPNASQYGHHDIRSALHAMSFNKCFYCERRLREQEGQVEHYIEVAEQPELAFEWHNLCLSCPECNRRKLPNIQISVTQCLHPCGTVDSPADHLTFADEYIRPRADSLKGAKTIQKYRLDRDELNYRRAKQLQLLERALRQIQTLRLQEGNRPLSKYEMEVIASFKQADHAFSLMFNVYLANIELEAA